MRQLEQRHTDIVRELTLQLTTDREHWSQLNTKLEKRIKQLEIDDAKHKQDLIRLQDENSALEKEQLTLQTQITELLETNIKLNNEIAESEDRQRDDAATNGRQETDEMFELMDKISNLQFENAHLRDKNDELVNELEEMHIEVSKMKMRKPTRVADHSGNEDSCSGGESNGTSATKRRGDSPSKTKLSEESPRLGKLRKCHNDNSEGESESSGDWLALNAELNQHSTPTSASQAPDTTKTAREYASMSDSRDEEIKQLKVRIMKLGEDLKEALHRTSADDSEKMEESGNATMVSADGDQTDAKPNYQARVLELEASLDQMQKEYEACEDYWQGKLNEERQLYEEEQRISDEKFNELLKKMSEYEEQFASSNEKDYGRLSPIEEKCFLETQYSDLEAEAEELRENARQMLEAKSIEIDQLQGKIQALEQRLSEGGGVLQKAPSDAESVASSPISYLWNQSTIQAPTRDYQNPNWNVAQKLDNIQNAAIDEAVRQTVSPIQRPQTPLSSKNTNTLEPDNNDDASSVRSFGTHSVASTHSIHRSIPEALRASPNVMREDIKRLKLIELQLKDEVKGLAHQRDGLVMELQQLTEAKPMLEKAYTRTPHPSLTQRIQQLESKNRQLQYCLKQQQHYTESIMHQTWQQQRSEINELRNTLETQGIIINEQAQRLANSDLLVKDLYVENSQLTAAIQRLEQQRSRSNLLLQHQGIGSVPGML